MTHYRLLRDNKETGPYSEEDMIAKGFKPYDLIWVEGKSAGWRYPSEIPAFKNYTQAIEEQPYDRFYKKQPPQKLFAEEKTTQPSYYTALPAAAKTMTTAEQQPLPVAAKQTTQQAPIPDYTIQAIPGRHIHVTLPSGNTVNLSTIATRKENKEVKEVAEPFKAAAYTPAEKKVNADPARTAQPFIPDAEKETLSQVFVNNTAGNSDDTDDNHVPFVHQPRSFQPPAGFSWSLVAAACIGIATLVGLGIMIGLGISRDKNDLAFNEALLYKSKQTANLPDSRVKPAATNTVADEPVTAADEPTQVSPVKDLVQNAVVKSNIANTDTKKLPEEKIIPEKNKPLSNTNQPATSSKPMPAATAINIEKHLLLTANDFKTGAFGGISGLKYTLANSSALPLESVEVEIDYIQANDKVYKTERVLFKNISAGAQTTLEAPSSSRGIKLSTRIIKVNPKEGISNTTAKS